MSASVASLLCNSEALSDVELVACDGLTRIPAHRFIIGACRRLSARMCARVCVCACTCVCVCVNCTRNSVLMHGDARGCCAAGVLSMRCTEARCPLLFRQLDLASSVALLPMSLRPLIAVLFVFYLYTDSLPFERLRDAAQWNVTLSGTTGLAALALLPRVRCRRSRCCAACMPPRADC